MFRKSFFLHYTVLDKKVEEDRWIWYEIKCKNIKASLRAWGYEATNLKELI